MEMEHVSAKWISWNAKLLISFFPVWHDARNLNPPCSLIVDSTVRSSISLVGLFVSSCVSHSSLSCFEIWCPNWLLYRLSWCCSELYFSANAPKIISKASTKAQYQTQKGWELSFCLNIRFIFYLVAYFQTHIMWNHVATVTSACCLPYMRFQMCWNCHTNDGATFLFQSLFCSSSFCSEEQRLRSHGGNTTLEMFPCSWLAWSDATSPQYYSRQVTQQTLHHLVRNSRSNKKLLSSYIIILFPALSVISSFNLYHK